MSRALSLPWFPVALIVILAVATIGRGTAPASAATFTVTKTADTADGTCNADCSLREAIIAAEAAGGADTISFDPAAFPQGTPATIAVGGSELPTLSDTTVDGTGAGVIIDGSGLVSGTGLNFNSGGSLTGATVRNVTIQNFPDEGINMNAFSDLVDATIADVVLNGNEDGINLNAGADNTGATISNTTASGSAGTGININAGDNLNDATISGSTVSGNGDEGVNLNAGADNTGATISDTTVSGNSSTGIVLNAGGNLTDATISSSTISGNGEGGVDACCGGGLGTSLTITNSTISGNTLDNDGGGLYQDASSAVITGSTISGNTAADGEGGGIANYGVLSVTNSTISGNTAAFDGGGIYTGRDGELTLTNVTITGNTTQSFDSGGGLFGDGSPVDVKNTIIAGNVDTGGVAPDCGGPITSQGHNLIQDTTGCTITGDTTGNITGQDPNLGALAGNGGPTQTHALLAGSPAIDAADDSGCPSTDQRGVSRPQDGDEDGSAVCDIGAYELQPAQATPTPTGTPTPTASPAALPPSGATPTGDSSAGRNLAVAVIALAGLAAGAWALRRRLA